MPRSAVPAADLDEQVENEPTTGSTLLERKRSMDPGVGRPSSYKPEFAKSDVANIFVALNRPRRNDGSSWNAQYPANIKAFLQ
jgi:hypothetical protein